jgi:hypothetical protein
MMQHMVGKQTYDFTKNDSPYQFVFCDYLGCILQLRLVATYAPSCVPSCMQDALS